MTFVRLAFFPEGTVEHYKAVADAMGVTAAPDGRLLFAAGEAPGGWQVVQVWRTREGLEQFNRTVFFPALAAVSAPGFPRPPEVTDFHADVLSLGGDLVTAPAALPGQPRSTPGPAPTFVIDNRDFAAPGSLDRHDTTPDPPTPLVPPTT